MTDRRLDFANGRVRVDWAEGTGETRTPQPHVVTRPWVDLLARPGGPRDRQLLFNDVVDVLEIRAGYAFVRAAARGYVGYLPADALAPEPEDPIPSAWVAAPLTHAYAAPDFKSPERAVLSMGTNLSQGAETDRFVETELGWVPRKHLSRVAEPDPVAVAERLLGTPYLWGGGTALGVDCSGLVWLAFALSGQILMSDSDLQLAHDGDLVEIEAPPKRGDLLFWKGHVALMRDAETILHATAHAMAVVIEPRAAAIARIEAAGDGPVIGRRRIGL